MKNIEITRMAFNICGITIDDMNTDLILRVINKVESIGVDFSLKDASEILAEWKRDYKTAE